MANFVERVQNLWNAAKAGKAKTRATFAIPDPNGKPFQKSEQYFQVIINEMYLANERQWWLTYDPLVLIVSSYLYGKNVITVPSVVGPDLFKQYQEQVPLGFIIRNAPVTSLHPYQGGALTLTIFLNQVKHANNAEKVLSVLESVSSVGSPAAPLIPFSMYLQIAGTVMDGIETLLNLPETISVLAYRFTVNPQLIGQIFAPTYIVMIDEEQAKINPQEFWVHDSRLVHGKTEAGAKPYEDADFVLLQVAQSLHRSDERTLDFYPLYEKTVDLAAQASTDFYWNEAKAHFNTLKRSMLTNPDLIKDDFNNLSAQYLEDISTLRKQAAKESALAGKGLDSEEMEMQKIAKALDDLDEL